MFHVYSSGRHFFSFSSYNLQILTYIAVVQFKKKEHKQISGYYMKKSSIKVNEWQSASYQ